MFQTVTLCTHVKNNGVACGSPAVAGTELCYHHSAVKTATGHEGSGGNHSYGGFTPIPFVFPEDRASMQIDYFLLLQAFNEHQIDLRAFKAMMSMLKAMDHNLGKTGSLMEESDQPSAVSEEKVTRKPTSQKRDVGHPQQAKDAASESPFEFSPELMAEFEEIEKLDMNDPRYADLVRAAVAKGTKELRAQGIDLMEI
jgi:hypothetical protein